ncbi:hypothetical protein QAD02_023853, partial [Eretmocerus hayati]
YCYSPPPTAIVPEAKPYPVSPTCIEGSHPTTGTQSAHNCQTNCHLKIPACPTRFLRRRSAMTDGKDIRQTRSEASSPQDNLGELTLPRFDEGILPQTTNNPSSSTIHTLDSVRQYNYADASEYPYFVTVDVRNGNWPLDRLCPDRMQRKHYSKGLIISRNYVLWAGFVCPRICTYIVIVGSDEFGKGGDLHRAEAVQYEDWRKWKVASTEESGSVLLLKLYQPITFGVGVQPVKLSDIGEHLSSARSGILVYEHYFLSQLLKGNRIVLSSRDCEKVIYSLRFSSVAPHLDYTRLPAETFCLIGSEDPFEPVIDGMFFVDGKLFGIPYRSIVWRFTGGRFIFFLLMHDVSHYRDFIKNHTGV